MTLFLNVCQSETYRISAERNKKIASKCVYIYTYTHIYIYIYIYICIYIVLFSPRVMDFLHQHMTEPHSTSQIHQTSHQFSSSACQQNSCKNPGQCNVGHWAWVISPYRRTTIPKDCHKNTRCVSLAQSISIALTSQQIVQLGQLYYPFGPLVPNSSNTHERMSVADKHLFILLMIVNL